MSKTNKTQEQMDKSITGNSRMQGITDGTSTTMEKKAFVDTIKEEIDRKNTEEGKAEKAKKRK